MAKPRHHSLSPLDTQSSKPDRSTKDNFFPTRNGNKPISPSVPPKPTRRPQSRSLQKLAQEEAKRIPDIRQERVDRIRAAMESGEYHISSSVLANRIYQDILLDESLPED